MFWQSGKLVIAEVSQIYWVMGLSLFYTQGKKYLLIIDLKP